MSNSLFMDESNGNGVFASKPNNSATTTTAAATQINNLMNVSAATTATLPTSVSNEDLSQSLSEYTDADESISAPTEFLAEFLSAVMLKDYKKALKYCKLILQYEPNNDTALEFYPLIQEKLKAASNNVKTSNQQSSSDSDENYNKSSSPEVGLDQMHSSNGESDEAYEEQQVGIDDNNCSRSSSNSSSNSMADDESLSISDDDDDDNVDNEPADADDEDVDENAADVEEEDDDNNGEDEDDEEDVDVDPNSSSGEELPIDELNFELNVANAGPDIRFLHSSSGGEGRSRSDNTTHSYSSLLLEEEEADDIVPANLACNTNLPSPDLDVSNGNKIISASCSDSESPTEPLTQRLAAILKAKCGVGNGGNNK